MAFIGNATLYDEIDKEFFVSQAKEPGVVDELMQPLVEAINDIATLVTMNCCQGGGTIYPDGTHCPITYVDFYAINHDYFTANTFLAFVVAEVGNTEICSASMDFEEDGEVDDEDYWEANGLISPRYRLKGGSPEDIPTILDAVKRFQEQMQ